MNQYMESAYGKRVEIKDVTTLRPKKRKMTNEIAFSNIHTQTQMLKSKKRNFHHFLTIHIPPQEKC